MSAHHLQHERPLVGSGRGIDTVYGFADPMQRGGSTNRQIGHGHIVVDRPDESDDFEMAMFINLSFRDLSCL